MYISSTQLSNTSSFGRLSQHRLPNLTTIAYSVYATMDQFMIGQVARRVSCIMCLRHLYDCREHTFDTHILDAHVGLATYQITVSKTCSSAHTLHMRRLRS